MMERHFSKFDKAGTVDSPKKPSHHTRQCALSLDSMFAIPRLVIPSLKTPPLV